MICCLTRKRAAVSDIWNNSNKLERTVVNNVKNMKALGRNQKVK